MRAKENVKFSVILRGLCGLTDVTETSQISGSLPALERFLKGGNLFTGGQRKCYSLADLVTRNILSLLDI